MKSVRDWSCLRIDHIEFWLLSTAGAGFFNTGRYGAIIFWISFINTHSIMDSILEFPDHGLFQKKLYEVPVF